MLRQLAFFSFIVVPTLLGQTTTFTCAGSTYTVAEGINNSGTITGYFYGSSGGAQGFTTTTGSPSNCTAFTISGATNTFPQAIDSSGNTSGYYIDSSALYHGFLRTAAGSVTTIDYPNTNSNTVVFDINNIGTVILNSNNGVYFRKADSTFPPVSFSHPVLLSKMGINDTGTTIVGTVGTSQNPGCFIDTYPGGSSTSFSYSGAASTFCFDINNGNTISGTYFAGQSQFAFVRTSASTVITLNGLASASANGLNDNNQAVGSYSIGPNQVGAFIWNYLATPTALSFFPLSPCRMVDTRAGQGKSGFFGPPSLAANTARDFPLLSSGCNVPISVQAYSLNATVSTQGPLGFLSLYPSGQSFPGVSTLNSPDGSILANAAIVPAGSNGSVTALASQNTDLILDVNGYFAPPTTNELVFYPVPPCRVADTRTGQGKSGFFGPPSLSGSTTRSFPISSDGCGVPNSAQAYSLNMTVVPQGRLDFLSTWPTGQPYPNVSTLNSPDGSVIANAAIVPAGTAGNINVLASNPTDLIIDVNGYFAPPGGGGALHFYPVTPCRVADTRAGLGKTGAFGPPSLVASSSRDFPISASNCNIPNTALAYALNMTAVPQGRLDFLSAYTAGQPYPGVSTLNSPKGTVIANLAIVPAGTNGAITVVAGNPTDLIIDISGYFAP